MGTEKKGTEEMDEFVAMFNCHVNDGLKKSCAAFKRKFGSEKFNQHIQPRIKEGIMSIFRRRENKYTRWFVERNKDVVNGKS